MFHIWWKSFHMYLQMFSLNTCVGQLICKHPFFPLQYRTSQHPVQLDLDAYNKSKPDAWTPIPCNLKVRVHGYEMKILPAFPPHSNIHVNTLFSICWVPGCFCLLEKFSLIYEDCRLKADNLDLYSALKAIYWGVRVHDLRTTS